MGHKRLKKCSKYKMVIILDEKQRFSFANFLYLFIQVPSLTHGAMSLHSKFLIHHISLVAGAWTERKKMYHGGSFLKLADDNMDIQNPEAQNRELSGF